LALRLGIEIAQARYHLATEEADVVHRVLVVEMTALAEEQQID
jgi:hypothetical protein